MFDVYFGKYLQDIGVISEEEYLDIIEANRKNRVRLGIIAVSDGLMTEEQADEVNRIQAQQDARFGDIAVAKGYLTDAQVGELLKKQGDSYLLLVQELLERNILSLEDIQKHINHYKKSERFTSLDIDALKSSDIDSIIQVFIREMQVPAVIKDYLALMARNMVRFVDNKVRFERIEKIYTYTNKNIASQSFTGDYELFIGIGGAGNKIIGESYGKEKFEEIDEDCLDAVCEFINVSNGIYASKLSQEEIKIDMLPPTMYTDVTTIDTDGIMFLLPCFIQGQRVDIVVCMETKWQIK
ncbi:MAG: chemotaxis protein CheC [Lachnospiraceae bacterium]|nr:chemotaxis protein CheC [Lachnospiraceae bacterium]